MDLNELFCNPIITNFFSIVHNNKRTHCNPFMNETQTHLHIVNCLYKCNSYTNRKVIKIHNFIQNLVSLFTISFKIEYMNIVTIYIHATFFFSENFVSLQFRFISFRFKGSFFVFDFRYGGQTMLKIYHIESADAPFPTSKLMKI